MYNRYKILIALMVLSVLLTGVKLTGQKVFYGPTYSGIYIYDIQNCTYEQYCIRRFSPPPAPGISDITITPDSIIYTNTIASSNYLQKVDIYYRDHNSIDSCYYYYEADNYQYNNFSLSAINCNKKGDIFVLGWEFLKYHTDTKTWEYIGKLPAFYNNIQYKYKGTTSGTLTRRNDNYYFIWGLTDKNYNILPRLLVRLDTIHPENSTVLHQFTDSMIIKNMFTIRENCDEYTTYITYRLMKDNWSVTVKEALAVLDFDTYTITDVCINDSILNYYAFPIEGVADPWTIYDFECKLIVDLDADNSSGATGKYDYVDTVLCKYDSIRLSDFDSEVFAYDKIDSMHIWFADSPPDGNFEYLRVSQYAGVTVKGSGTQRISLSNAVNTDFAPLELAVRNITYHNAAVNPTPGVRKIAFLAYGGTRTSDTAYAYIHLLENNLVAGSDTTVEVCKDDGYIDIKTLLTSNAYPGGRWYPAIPPDGIFDPSYDSTVTYLYIVDSPECGNDTAEIRIIVNPLPEFDLGNDTTVCKDESITLHCSIDNAQYRWQDGSTGKTYEVQDSGMYILSVINQNGCEYTDSIRINYYPDDNTLVEKDSLLCYGDTVIWNGIEIKSDGDYPYELTNRYGCDSTTILHVQYQSPVEPQIWGDSILCPGDTVILYTGNYREYRWSTGDTANSIIITQGGKYQVEVTDTNGCQGQGSISVTQPEELQIEVQKKDERCYNENDGSIKINHITGGIGTIRYYINGTEVIADEKQDGLSPGKYTVEAIDSFGCTWSQEVIIDAAEQILVDLGEDITVTEEGTVLRLQAKTNVEDIDTIRWYKDGELIENRSLTYEFSPLGNTEIIVQITDRNGCKASDTIKIQVRITREIEINIPDIFSPDGDGLNDTWSIRGNKQIQEIEYMEIYDRWGEKISALRQVKYDPAHTILWDGNYKGKPVNPGVYVFVIRFKMQDGNTITKSGDITVIR